MSKSTRIIYILNFFGLTAMLGVNFLANLLPINGQTTEAVSDKYMQLFSPAPFTFAIWSVIYIGLTGFILYQFRAVNKKAKSGEPTGFITEQLGLTFFISCLANLSWVIAWHYEQLTLTVILMALLLLSLIDINRRINKIGNNAHQVPKQFRWYVKAPFGLYLGWVCIAFVANVAVYLTSKNYGTFGLSEVSWTMLMISMGGFLALFLLSRLNLYSGALGIAWGLFGILYNYWNKEYLPAVQISAMIFLALIGIGIAWTIKKRTLVQS